MPALTSEVTTAMPPGICDVFWVQRPATNPILVAEDVVVEQGVAEVRITTGAVLETANWVPNRLSDSGWFGAIITSADEFDLVNWTAAGDSIVLPTGQFDFFYEVDENDEDAPISLGTYLIEPAFGGLGIEVTMEDG